MRTNKTVPRLNYLATKSQDEKLPEANQNGGTKERKKGE